MCINSVQNVWIIHNDCKYNNFICEPILGFIFGDSETRYSANKTNLIFISVLFVSLLLYHVFTAETASEKRYQL